MPTITDKIALIALQRYAHVPLVVGSGVLSSSHLNVTAAFAVNIKLSLDTVPLKTHDDLPSVSTTIALRTMRDVRDVKRVVGNHNDI